MEFTASREALVKELGVIRAAVEKKNTIPVLVFALLEVSDGTLKITGTDQDVTIITSLSVTGKNGSFCVPALPLFNLLRLFVEDEVVFTLEKNERIRIVCGKSKHLLPTLTRNQFPEVEKTKKGEKAALPGQTLRAMVKAALLAVSTDPNERKAHCVSLNLLAKDGFLEITGTTEKHLLTTNCAIPQPSSFDALLSRKAAQVLLGFAESEKVEMEISEDHAVFTSEHRKMIARLTIGKFVAWRTMIPDVDGHAARLPVAELQAALRRASVTAEEYHRFRALNFEFTKTNLTIESRETESGKSVEPVTADCPSLNGDTWNVGIHAIQVLDFLSLVESDTLICEVFPPKIVKDKDGKETEWPRAIRFTPGTQGYFNYEYYTQPVRID